MSNTTEQVLQAFKSRKSVKLGAMSKQTFEALLSEIRVFILQEREI